MGGMWVLITDCPPEDRAEVRRTIEQYNAPARLLRVGDELGSAAKRAMLVHRKEHGDMPEYDYVWIEAA